MQTEPIKIPDFEEFMKMAKSNPKQVKKLKKLNIFKFGETNKFTKPKSISKYFKQHYSNKSSSIPNIFPESELNLESIICNSTQPTILNIMYYNMFMNTGDTKLQRFLNFMFISLYIKNTKNIKLPLIFLNHNFIGKTLIYEILKKEIKYDILPVQYRYFTKSELIKELSKPIYVFQKNDIDNYLNANTLLNPNEYIRNKCLTYNVFMSILIHLLIKYNLKNRKKYIDLFYTTLQTKHTMIIGSAVDNLIFTSSH